MRFLQPLWLWWAGLAIVPILLYLFRRRPRRERVSTLLFFKALAREHQESPWLRFLKRLLSLLLTLLVLWGIVLSLAQPVVAPDAASLRSVVVVVDRSASMAATTRSGHTGMELARRQLTARVAAIPAGVDVSLIAYDQRPEILLPRTRDRRDVLRAIHSLRVRPVAGDVEPAMALAEKTAQLALPAAIWHVSDAPTTRLPASDTVTLENIVVAGDAPVNAGITAFQVRRLPMGEKDFEAFVEVHATAPEAVDVTLEELIDGNLVSVRILHIEPGQRERLLLSLEAGSGQVLTLRTILPDDMLPTDDVVYLTIPAIRTLRVLWVTPNPDPFTEMALTALGDNGGIEVYHAAPSSWPPRERPDVLILDGWLPDEWPADYPVLVIQPPASCGPIRTVALGKTLPVSALRAADPRHPLLYGVATERVSVSQTAVLTADPPFRPLWLGPAGPVMIAGELDGQRAVVMGFVPVESERLPLMASYPMLMGNTILWLAETLLAEQAGSQAATGTVMEKGAATVTWRVPGSTDATSVTLPPTAALWELDRVGLWSTDDGAAGSAALVSRQETLLPTAPAVSQAEDGLEGRAAAARLLGDLAPALLWGILVILLLESALFHRYAVY